MSFSDLGDLSDRSPPTFVLKEHETQLVENVKAYVKEKYPDEYELITERFICLQGLGAAISRYPSVRDTQILQGTERWEEDLITALSNIASASHLFHVPTKVVAARSFLVAKYHAFSLLSKLVQGKDESKRDELKDEFYTPLRSIIFSVVSTLMAEDVYFSCLDDPSFSQDIKTSLAHDLVALWDSGRDPRASRHLPALESLWIARDVTPPSFGTMDGSSELVRVSMELGDDWQEFLLSALGDNDTKWALEEFLFGLSYEEISKVRSRLLRMGIRAVGYNEVRSYIGSHPVYGMVKDAEPREIYDFYVARRNAALFRKRTSAAGPHHTLEDIYLKHLITQEQ
jgi:hypothetical protein